MMLDLDREHALFESELGVALGAGAGGGGEEVRQLTVRLLLGSRVPAGALLPKAATTAFASSSPPMMVVAENKANYSTERPPERSGRERVLHLELCDAEDPYFLYSLDVGEGDFHELRREHGLLVDFAAFPSHFIELLERCADDDASSSQPQATSRFFAALDVPTSQNNKKGGEKTGLATFAVVEANKFKRVTQVALAVRAGDDAAVKAFLAGRLRHVSNLAKRLEGEKGVCEADLGGQKHALKAALEHVAALEEEKRRFAQDADGERAAASAAAREAHAAAVGDLREQHGAELRAERARLQEEVDRAHKALREASAQRDGALAKAGDRDRLATDLSRRLEQAEDLLRTTEALASQERAGRLQVEAERDAADAAKHGFELQLATARQRAADAETSIHRADDLRRAADEARQRSTAQGEALAAALKKRDDQLAQAAGEIAKGNGIIEKLSDHARAAHAKLKLKAEVIRQQERRLDDAVRARDDADHKAALLDAEVRREHDRRSALETDLAATKIKVAESLELLDNNQKVIAWLNAELNEHQMGRRGGAGAFAADPRLAPALVSPTKDQPPNAAKTRRSHTPVTQPRASPSASYHHHHHHRDDDDDVEIFNGTAKAKKTTPRHPAAATMEGAYHASAARPPRDAAEAYFEEYGAFSAHDFHESASNSFDLASELFPTPEPSLVA